MRSHHTPSHPHSTCQNDGKGSAQGIGKQQETHVSLGVHQGLNPFFSLGNAVKKEREVQSTENSGTNFKKKKKGKPKTTEDPISSVFSLQNSTSVWRTMKEGRGGWGLFQGGTTL